MPWPFKSRVARAREAYQLRLFEARQRVLEATTDYWDRYVDPRDAYRDEHGDDWLALGAGPEQKKSRITTPQELDAVRSRCRVLAEENEFAINGHENRISYVVGTGLKYELEADEKDPVPDEVVDQAKAWLERVLDLNDWASFEQEAVHRGDRDGEAFIRTFYPLAGDEIRPTFRFVEPEDVATPPARAGEKAATWGILTAPEDVVDVSGYFIGDELVPAAEVTHVKLNVDRNQKRGIPTFHPVRKNLVRAEKLLRNMSAVATLQAAIALIREHEGFSKDQVETFRDDQDDFTVTNQTTGRTRHFQQFGPGTIVDAPAGTKYQFPVAGVAAEKFVVVLGAELRAVASRLVMPEFMFTSDASNANYASTMVSEGPAVKMFQRLQSFWREKFVAVLWSAVEHAVQVGVLPDAVLRLNLTASLPSLTVRDEEKEGKTLGREHEAGVLSKRTWAEIRGYDYDREQQRIDEEREHAMENMPALALPGPAGPDEGDDEGEDGDGQGGGSEE